MADALELGLEIARALAFAHQHGLVHRDVKPQNVLLNGDGQAKVTDFGIARSLDVEHGVTQTGTVLGTSDYIAPEQASGQQVDAQTDVYSLGVVLYELLAGERAVPRRELRHRRDEARQRAAAEPPRRPPGRAAQGRSCRRPRAREGSARALPDHGRVRGRARRLPRRRPRRRRVGRRDDGRPPAAARGRPPRRGAWAWPLAVAGLAAARDRRRRCRPARPAQPRGEAGLRPRLDAGPTSAAIGSYDPPPATGTSTAQTPPRPSTATRRRTGRPSSTATSRARARKASASCSPPGGPGRGSHA